MLTLLGDASQFRNLFDTTVAMFSRGDTLAHPEQLVGHLQTLSVVWAVLFLVLGVLCLLGGYKFYKVAVIGAALLFGMFFGYWAGMHINAAPIVAGCTGVLLAVTAFPLMKYAVAVLGGLAGAFTGANMWSGIASAMNAAGSTRLPADAYWVGALVGLIVCGMLAFVLFKLTVLLFTSVSGSTIAVLGVLALLLSVEAWRETIAEALTANPLVIPLLVLVPAVVGLVLQQSKGAGPAEG